MVDLVEVVGGGDVEIGGFGVELLADAVARGDGAIGGDAEVFIVLEENLLVVAGDGVAGDDGANTGAGGPLNEVSDEGRGKFAQAERVFLDLLREQIEGRGGFAVGGSEEEAAEGNAGLQVDPEKGAALEVRALLAGDEEIAVVAELDRDARAIEGDREGVGEAHVAAVVEDAAWNEELHELLELLVAEKIVGGGSGELVKVREIGGRQGRLEEAGIIDRAGRQGRICLPGGRCGRGLLEGGSG